MNVTSRIAARYLWTARKQRHIAFLSTISILGLAIGVFALLISIALLSGLQDQIKARLMESSPHLLIEPAGSNTIDDAGAIAAAARALGMSDVRPLVSGIGWGANENERRGRPVRIRSAALALPQGSIALSRDTAAALGLNTGDVVTIVAPRTRLTPFGPVPVWRKYTIARLLAPATDDRATEAVLPFDETTSLLGTNGKPTSIEMYGSVERAEDIQSRLQRQFPNVQVKTWKEINRPIFLALRLEKIVLFATISLIIFVAALNLISSLSMMILEKRPSVGVLRTLGATEGNVYALFLQVGLFIGITGTLLGNVFGIGAATLLDRYHLARLPRDMTFLNYLPFALDLSDIVLINAIAILLSIVATWYPARIAARLDPISAIKEEA
ncbi:MAG TPA: FtsX-like permease family protein [Thermoanaerobaculia bacterium]|jgi:lipoprotein-releasing system permease protein